MTSTPDQNPEPRFPSVSQRAFLRRTAFIGLAAAVPVLGACSASPSAAPGTGENATTIAGSASAAGDAATTVLPSTGAAGQAVPVGSQMQVNFTYQAAGGGGVHSPYIAVWIEDPNGDLVQTVSLWYKSDESKYLDDLKRWNSKNNSNSLTTGATRIPGTFSVAWDGTNLDGAAVAAGDYFVCVEAAREDGPYQIVREAISISGSLASTTLSPSGELTAVSVELVA